jgi:outer membrane protein assembly factor BamB
VAGGYAYLGGDHLSVINAKTGALQWTGAITTGETVSTTIVDNGMVYFVGNSTYNGGTLYAFNAAGCGKATCTPAWTVYNASGWGYSPAAANGVLYIGGIDNALYAFAEAGCGATTCAPLWKGTTSSRVLTPPAIANGVVYVSDWYPGDVLAFNASGCGSATCSSLWSYTLSGRYADASPTIANGMLYVSDDVGMLFAFHLPTTTSARHTQASAHRVTTTSQVPSALCISSTLRSYCPR